MHGNSPRQREDLGSLGRAQEGQLFQAEQDAESVMHMPRAHHAYRSLQNAEAAQTARGPRTVAHTVKQTHREAPRFQ